MIKHLIVGIAVGLLTAAPARASWVALTTAELLAQSDVIVDGTYLGATRLQLGPAQPPMQLGVVRVERRLRGDNPGDLALLVIGPADGPVVSTELRFQPGQRGIWLLRRYANSYQGLFVVDHPGRFVPIGHAGDLLKALDRLPAESVGPVQPGLAPAPSRALMAE